MKVLHISNDFCLTKVHSMLYQELDGLGVEQTVFNPVRDAALVGRNRFEGQHTNIIYAHAVKSWHKYAYHLKRRHVFSEMLKRINPEEYCLTHATTLLTDGGLAYQLYKRYGIPYIVAVRNTDVNEFLQFMPHTWMAARQILLHAEKILFIGKSLHQALVSHKAILIDPTDSHQVADAIVRLRDDNELCQRLSQGALATAQRLTIAERAANIIQFIKEKCVK